tara:strand:+ start:326 stop:1054 length:729 start_codon:yes stop_codon:yes gene_type:complete
MRKSNKLYTRIIVTVIVILSLLIIIKKYIKPFVKLDFLVSKKKIDELNKYLINEKDIFSWEKDLFIAKKQVHADSINLTNCNKCKKLKTHYDQRINRGNPFYHIPNKNFYKLPKLIEFINELNIFEEVGNIVIIINKPDESGIEHFDHKHKWVSEFIWIRTNDNKQFYVKDNLGFKHYINCNLMWFDDQRIHNIYPVSIPSFSIRVDGKFNLPFRKYIVEQNNFKKLNNKNILLAQKKMTFQ